MRSTGRALAVTVLVSTDDKILMLLPDLNKSAFTFLTLMTCRIANMSQIGGARHSLCQSGTGIAGSDIFYTDLEVAPVALHGQRRLRRISWWKLRLQLLGHSLCCSTLLLCPASPHDIRIACLHLQRLLGTWLTAKASLG